MHPVTSPKVLDAGRAIAGHLSEIKGLFVPGTKVTLIVRRPEKPDGSQDFVLTDDLIDEAIAALLRRKHDTRGKTAEVTG